MKWQNAIEDYQNYLKLERGLSQNTIAGYTRDLQKLVSFLEITNNSISPVAIDGETIKDFAYQNSKKVSARSQARILSGLRSFFSYLVFENYRKSNPADLIESPKII